LANSARAVCLPQMNPALLWPPSTSPLLTASRISLMGTTVPGPSRSSCRRPPDIFSIFSARPLMLTKCQSATGQALCTFHLMGALAAEALRAAKAAADAAAAMPRSFRRVT